MNNKVILDSNIIIYTGLTEHQQLRDWLQLKNISVSIISRIEVLGYHQLTVKDENYFKAFFKQCHVVSIGDSIIEKVIILRQQKKMDLGDSLIAATALVQNLPLVTGNGKDFKHIEHLKLINPLAG